MELALLLLLLLDDAPNVNPVLISEDAVAADGCAEDEDDTPNVKGETDVDGIEEAVEAEKAGPDVPKEKVDAVGTDEAFDDDAPNVNGDIAVALDVLGAANDGADTADDEAAAPNVKGCSVGAAVFFSASFCFVSAVAVLALLPNVNGVRVEDDAVDRVDEVEDDWKGVNVNGVADGATKENAGLDGAATLVSSSSSTAPPAALSSSHDVWSASSYDMPQTGQSPVFVAGAAGLLGVAAVEAAGLNAALLAVVERTGKAKVAVGVEVELAAVEDAPNVNGDKDAVDELFVRPPKLKGGTAEVGAVFLSAAAGAPNVKGVAAKDGLDGTERFWLSVSSCALSCPGASLLSSSHVEWSASSYDMPQTGQSPVFSFGLLLLLLPAVLLLLIDVAGALNAGNVNGVVEVDDGAAPLFALNMDGAPPLDTDDDDGAVAAAGTPKLIDGSDDDVLLVAVDEEDEDDEEEEKAGEEVLNVKGATVNVEVVVVAGAADLSLRFWAWLSVCVGRANGLDLCLLSSSSSAVRRLRLNDEDDRVFGSMEAAEDANGAMKGVEDEDDEEVAEETGGKDEEDDDEEPLTEAGGAKEGTAGNSALLLLCSPPPPPRSLPASLSLSLSLSCSLAFLSSTFFVAFLSSLVSHNSPFSSLSRSTPLRFSFSLPFSFSLTTTVGSCRLFTAVIAPPPVPPTPNPNFRVGSNRPRNDDRERGDADVAAAAAAAVCVEDEGSARDEMMGAGEGKLSRLVVRSGVRSSEARMR